MKSIIKWSGVAIAMLVLLSLGYYTTGKKKSSVSGDELFKSALIEIKANKDYPKAISLLKQTLAADSSYTEAEIALGHAYLLSGNIDSAQRHLKKALKKDSKNPDALQYLINANMQQQDTAAVLMNITRYLEHYPADKKIWLKKYVLELQHHEYIAAGSTAKILAARGLSEEVKTITHDHWLAAATIERKTGDKKKAYAYYQKALQESPDDPETLQQLVNLAVYRGDYPAALTYNNTLLESDMENRVYLVNASIIYAQLHQNELAESYAERAYLLYPADQHSKNNYVDVTLSLGKYAGADEKLRYANTVLQTMPSQKEALLLAINSHLVMRQLPEALEAANAALRYYPADRVFIDKKLGILYSMKNYDQAVVYLDALIARHPTPEYIGVYSELSLQMAVELIKEQRWNDALSVVKKGLAFDKNNKELLEQQVTIYASMGRYDEATSTADQLIAHNAANANYKFKKVGLLEQQGKFEEAASIAYELKSAFPATSLYKTAYRDQIDNTARKQMRENNWPEVIATYNKSVSEGNPSYYVLLYGIGAYSKMQNFQGALAATGTALSFFPDDSLFQVKRALALTELCRFPEGLSIINDLAASNPRDGALKEMQWNELLTAGVYYRNTHKYDTARTMFLQAIAIAPSDTFAIQNMSAIHFYQKQYDSSIYYANLGLRNDSNNAFLLMKKASAYEELKNYRMAYASADKLLKVQPSSSLADYAASLKNRSNNNQVGLSYLQSIFPGATQYANIAGIDYMRRFSRGSVTTRVNLGRRPTGIGAQGGLDIFYAHDSNYYSNLFAYGAVGHAFPYLQGGYSLFRNFRHGWEGELGARFLGLGSITNYTGVASVAKYFGGTWINARGFYTKDDNNWYRSCQITVREYLNDRSDYVTAMVGFGRIPDDHSQIYNFNQYMGYGSKSVGVGFQKSFRYSTTLKMNLNYTELKLGEGRVLNEYDIYVRLSRNF